MRILWIFLFLVYNFNIKKFREARMRTLLLSVLTLFFHINAGTEAEIIIKNESSRPVYIDHFTDHYTNIPMKDMASLEEEIAPGKKAIVHFSVMSVRYPQFLSKIQSNEIEKDGIYFMLDEKPFKLTWGDLNPSVETATDLADAKIVLKKLNGPHFVLVIKESLDTEDNLNS